MTSSPSGGRSGRSAIGLAFLSLLVPVTALAHEVPLWITSPQRPCPADPLSKVAKRCVVVEVQPGVLSSADMLKLSLPDGDDSTVIASKVEFQQLGGKSIWHGSIKSINGKPFSSVTFSSVTFSVVRDTVVGIIAFDGRMFRLRTTGGVQVVEWLETSSLPQGAPPVEYPPPPSPAPPTPESEPTGGQETAADLCETDDPNRVDVLVVYTAAARDAAGGTADMSAWIDLQVFEANRSYLLSNAKLRVNLAQSKEIAYTEDGNNNESLDDLTDGDDGLNDAHDWRNQYKADAVVLITYWPGAGISGLANLMKDYHIPDGNFESFEPLAFAVVDAGGFLTAEFTFAHELGHLLGAQHNSDAEGVTAGAIPASSFGYYDETPGVGCNSWMTIMAVRQSAIGSQPSKCLTCDRLPNWSSLDSSTKQCGDPVGSDFAKNRDTLNLTAPIVSAFRCGPPTPKPPVDVSVEGE